MSTGQFPKRRETDTQAEKRALRIMAGPPQLSYAEKKARGFFKTAPKMPRQKKFKGGVRR